MSAAPYIDQAWLAWKETFYSVIDQQVPSRMAGQSQPKLPWMNNKLKELIKQKHSAWKTYKHLPTTSNLSTFRSLQNKVTSALRIAEERYLQALHSDIHVPTRCSSVKNFWSYIK